MGVLFLVRASDLGRTTSAFQKSVSVFREIIGDGNMTNVVVVVTMESESPWNRQQPGGPLDSFITYGAQAAHYDGHRDNAVEIVQLLQGKQPAVRLQLQQELLRADGRKGTESSAMALLDDRPQQRRSYDDDGHRGRCCVVM